MIIDTKKIEDALLFYGKADYAAERLGINVSRVNQYRQKATAKSYRNWENMKLSEAMRIMEILNAEEQEKESDEKE